MKIGVDARFYGVRRKGLGRYTQKLIENLEKIDQTNKYVIFLQADNFGEYTPRNKNFKKIIADYPWYSWQEQIHFPRLLRSCRLDVMHFPHFNVPLFYRRRFVVTIHDLILLHFPTRRNTTRHSLVYWFKFLAYRLVIRSAILRSNRLITVSRFTKRDILDNFKTIPQEKIAVTYEAAEDFCMLSPNKDKEILQRYGIIKPYVMYVGNAYPHKNLERLVRSFRLVRKQKKDLQMVLVGKEDYFYNRLKEIVKDEKIENVVFAGYVPDYDLDVMFHNAELYVFPSLYEGFGLPPLEAMAKGVPVVSSDHACMREILGDSAYFFKATEEKNIADAVLFVLDDRNLRDNLVKKGFEQIRHYSWKQMARKTLAVYNQVYP